MLKCPHETKPILIVEDSDDDFEYTMRALKECKVKNPIYRAKDGQEALDYLFQRGTFTSETAQRPGLILLDLNMYGIDGREVLRQIKSHLDLKVIPVIVLTTSSQSRDVEACYGAGANSFLQKPDEVSKFFEIVRRLKEYWLEIAILPEGACFHDTGT